LVHNDVILEDHTKSLSECGIKEESTIYIKTVAATMPNKCNFEGCAKKIAVIVGDCKFCQKKFCTQHRLPEDHDCEFDFMSKDREKLKKANPLVTATKLVKF